MTAQVARIVALSKQLDSAHTGIWDLRSQFSEVTTTTISNASADKEALHNQLDDAHADIENLRGKLMASQEKANDTTAYASDLKDSRVTINLLQAETIMLNIDIGGLKAENIEFRAEMATANTTNSGIELYETALGEFKAHTDDLNIKVDTAADDRTAPKTKLERISCEIAGFQDKLTITNTAADRVCAQKERTQAAAAANTTSDIQLKKMARENTELNNELATTSAAAGKYQTQNRELWAQNERLVANLETVRAAVTTATNNARAERKAHSEQLDSPQ
ncbi:hypothetical protein GGF37_002303 [Kickxella alabastrina]|nr:hypothetical protein GGF37_002303 [Kickxella alabastrina]